MATAFPNRLSAPDEQFGADHHWYGSAVVKVVVVEDDPQIRSSLEVALQRVGHQVCAVGDGASALSAVLRDPPDLVLLDLGLPDVDGSTLLTMLRTIGTAAVIAVTARTEPEEIVRILDLGADDYVTKPFDVDQLDARIRAVVRRSSAARQPELPARIVVGDLILQPMARELTRGDRVVELRHLEYELLLTLALADGQLVPSEGLIRRLWGEDLDPAEGAARLDVQLSLLRRKLGETATRPRYLHRVRGKGIRLSAPGEQ